MITRTWRGVWSPQLKNRRDVDVYLPDSYRGGSRHYPVVYMQDGQNLSDPEKAFAGTWQIERALDELAAMRSRSDRRRVHHGGGGGFSNTARFPIGATAAAMRMLYLAFLVDTLKPRIDRFFRTRRERDATVILGSSMGGLLSLYGYFRYPSVFGRAGVMSPSIWYRAGRDSRLHRRGPDTHADVCTSTSAPPKARGRCATRVDSAVCWCEKDSRGSGGDVAGAAQCRDAPPIAPCCGISKMREAATARPTGRDELDRRSSSCSHEIQKGATGFPVAPSS